MKLKGGDRATKYLRLCQTGIITQEDYDRHLSFFDKSNFAPLHDWGIDIYQGLINCQTDFDKVKYLYGVRYGKISALWKLSRLTVAQYFGAVAYLKHGIEHINKMFEAIPRPEVSPAVEAILKQGTDFGFYGIIDTIAVRHKLTDDEAGKTPIVIAIAKMRIDAERNIAHQRIEQYNLSQIPRKR